MTIKERAIELVDSYRMLLINKDTDCGNEILCTIIAKECALISVINEHNSLREQLFNLRVCGMIESEKVYFYRMDELFQIENELKYEIQNL